MFEELYSELRQYSRDLTAARVEVASTGGLFYDTDENRWRIKDNTPSRDYGRLWSLRVMERLMTRWLEIEAILARMREMKEPTTR